MIRQIPTTVHLNRLYFELAKIGAFCVGEQRGWPYKIDNKEELIALACDMSRHDPRLVDVLAEFFVRKWREINPAKLRGYYKNMKTPQTVAVIMEFLTTVTKDEEAVYLAQYLTSGLRPVPLQFYFFNLYSVGGRLATRAAEEGVYEYKKWGFLACERPVINSEKRLMSGTFDNVARRNILKRLIDEKKEISLGEYLSALKFTVSRQQALLDIKAIGLIKHGGAGRAVKWKMAA